MAGSVGHDAEDRAEEEGGWVDAEEEGFEGGGEEGGVGKWWRLQVGGGRLLRRGAAV